MLSPLKKAPLGGIDRRTLMARMQEEGPRVAQSDFDRDLSHLARKSIDLPKTDCVLVLGGSNGLGRALVMQLLFGEQANVFVVHNDSERLQIGPHHVAAMRAHAEKKGLQSGFINEDATNPKVVTAMITMLRAAYQRVHLFNGIASGAPKRYAEHGPTDVPDVDIEMDPIRQVADFSGPENAHGVGLVRVEVASEQDIEKTNRLMGTSSALWADALAAAGLLDQRSVIAFADYDFEPDNPVYAMGPLAGAKKLQRASMHEIRQKYGVHTARICYPAMNTTAISAIPGGLLMYAATASALGDKRLSLPELAAATMPIFTHAEDDIRLDSEYQVALARVRPLVEHVDEKSWRALIAGAFES